jgi:hypothetical protein
MLAMVSHPGGQKSTIQVSTYYPLSKFPPIVLSGFKVDNGCRTGFLVRGRGMKAA